MDWRKYFLVRHLDFLEDLLGVAAFRNVVGWRLRRILKRLKGALSAS